MSAEKLGTCVKSKPYKANCPMQRNSRWIGNSERFTIRYIVKTVTNFPEAEV